MGKVGGGSVGERTVARITAKLKVRGELETREEKKSAGVNLNGEIKKTVKDTNGVWETGNLEYAQGREREDNPNSGKLGLGGTAGQNGR
ncbi:hypothetical protein SLA2020_366140 [Shorea laevis]